MKTGAVKLQKINDIKILYKIYLFGYVYVTNIWIYIFNCFTVNGTSKFRHYNIIIYSAKINSTSEKKTLYLLVLWNYS